MSALQPNQDLAYYSQGRPGLVRQVSEDPANVILDVGCGAGKMSSALKGTGRAGELWGVEVVPDVAEHAKQNPDLDRVFSGDITTIVDELPKAYFTHVMAGDVLEHLVDPWGVLEKLHGCLKPGGRVVASLPNIRNFSFFGKLFFLGSFRYKDSGVLDRTHLRFFARKDMEALFRGAGFENISIAQARPKKNIFNKLAKLIFGDLAIKVLMITADKPRG